MNADPTGGWATPGSRGAHRGAFSSAIAAENARGFTAVIPDIKCVSPKEGDLLRGRDPVETAKYLVQSGAPLLSVVTERENFGGSPGLLRSIAQAVDVPVLRKDFITNTDMLEETAGLGAAAVLLIYASAGEANIKLFYEKSIDLGLEPFVEVHTAKEMEFARKLGARLIGINNRDILTLERDSGGPGRTAALMAEARGEGADPGSGPLAETLFISESGIMSPEDAAFAAASGANAILVGTALWQAGDMGAMYQALRVERKHAPCALS